MMRGTPATPGALAMLGRVALAVSLTLVVLLGGGGHPALSPARAAAAGTLTILKTLGEGDTPGQPLAGIEFTAQLVRDMPLTDSQTLATIAATTPDALAGAGHDLAAPIPLTTDASGRAVAQGLADGVYLVREVPTRVGDVAYSVVAPFFVAVGLPDERGVAQRDVVVHAKNQPVSLTMTGTPQTVAPGESFTLGLHGTVPAPDRDGALHRYVMVVQIDPHLEQPTLGRVWISAGGVDTPLVEGADFVTQWDAAGHLVKVELTPAGLAKLAAIRKQHPDTHVHAEISGTIAGDTPDGVHLSFIGALFTDGWELPATLAAAVEHGIRASTTTRVVAPGATTPPAVTPGAESAGSLLQSLASTGDEVPWLLPAGAVVLLATGVAVRARARRMGVR